jgi:hypothetical protein
LARFEFESGTVLFCLSFTFVSFGESCLLVSWCAGGRCAMACSDEDRGKSWRPGAEDWGWSHRSRGRVAPHAVCTWHAETRSASFMVETQNQGRRFLSGLVSKPLGLFSLVWPQNWRRRFLAVWPQNLLQRFSLVGPQNQWHRFSLVWPQNWWRRFLPVWPQNRWWVSWLSLKTKVVEGFLIWASKPAALVW